MILERVRKEVALHQLINLPDNEKLENVVLSFGSEQTK